MAGSICSVSGGCPSSQSATAQSRAAPAGSAGGLSPQQQTQISELAATDRHVRAHEQAHLAAAGPFATGGASYSTITGPDGRQYAVGGEVGLDTAPVSGDPGATIEKARVIEAAANAPADPSSQDRAVAAAAAAMEQAAEMELAKSQQAAIPSLVKSAYGQTSDSRAGQLLSVNA